VPAISVISNHPVLQHMKASVKSLLFLVLFAVLFAAPPAAQAQGKIGVVNLRAVFEGYYKRKLADAKIKERAGELDKELEEKLARRKAAEEAYNTAAASAGDLSASKEERDRRKENADRRLLAVKDIEKEITTFRQQAEAILKEQQTRMRSRVLEEINAEIEAKAKADGFYIVIDKDADSRNDTKVLVFHNGDNDITTAILAKLNSGAPATLNLDEGADPAKK
jgi:Skp family chaperone for outer membrane proteins